MSAHDAPEVAGDRRRNREARAVFDDWCADLRIRLRRVCAWMPTEEFERLIARMNRVRLKYESTSAVPVARSSFR